MASVSRRLVLLSRRCPSRIPSNCAAPKCASQWQRPLSTSGSLRADEPSNPDSATPSEPAAPIAKQKKNTKVASRKIDEAARLRKLAHDLKEIDEEIARGAPSKQDWWQERDLKETDFIPKAPSRERIGFWGEGEEQLGPDEDFYGDDLTTLGHGELEQHREIREYARLIAWELPLLNQLARPFEPPTAATPFRFRYTSYLGESHPATNKVVVEFSVNDLNLTAPQISKLIKLAGPRYNPSTSIIKMSCEDYDTQTQNKRFLGDTIDKLIKEAKDKKDTFEDVPFDFRHHKPKPRYEFPKEWIMTPEKKAALDEKRKLAAIAEDEKLNNGFLVDGKKVVESSLPMGVPEPQPVLVSGPRGRALR